MTNETENFSAILDELNSTDFGKSLLKTLVILSFLAPEEFPEVFIMEKIFSTVFETEDVDAGFEDFQAEMIEELKAKGLLKYHEWSESFTMPVAVGEIVQSRYGFEEKKEILHLTYYSLDEFFRLYEEEAAENYELYVSHSLHALKYAETYEISCEHTASLTFIAGLNAVENESYDEAVELFKQALAIAENEFEISNTVADFKSHLANVYKLQKKYVEAVEINNQSLDLNKQLFGEESSRYADSLHSHARIFYSSGDYTKAVELYKRTIEIQTKTLDQDSPDLIYSTHNLALAYARQDNYKDALVLLEKALKMYENAEIDDADYLEKLQGHIENYRKKLAG